MVTILIVDDEINTVRGLKRSLNNAGYNILTANNGRGGLEQLKKSDVDLVLSDLRMPDMDGLTLIREVVQLSNPPIIIMMTAYGSIPTAVEAMKAGAYEYLSKPINLDELEIILDRALQAKNIKKENVNLKEQLNHKYGFEQLIGNSKAILDVLDIVKQVAKTKATVLIEGESGTGKELVARLIHQNSDRKKYPFVAVNCSALSPTLLESELFGHEKGAFTGAHERRKGRFEIASGGTLFLDEIGELDLSLQVKLLRVLQEKSFERVGSNETIETDVRLILATNKNLEDLVERKLFREDLFYRINVVRLNIPSLSKRMSDIPLLTDHFINELTKEHNKQILSIDHEVIENFQKYSWPGNVRELRNVIERMMILTKDKVLKRSDIPSQLMTEISNKTTIIEKDIPLKELEKNRIMQALKDFSNNKTQAAQALGISRRTLHRKLNEYEVK